MLEHKEPLVDAADWGQTEMVAFLLSQGADPNARNEWSTRPIHWAAQKGFLDIVKLLHEAKANCELKHDGGSSPLMLATSNKHPHIVDYLLNTVKVNPYAGVDFDSLDLAAQNGYLESVKLFLSTEKINVNRRVSSTGFTPLETAVYHGHWQIVELLLAAGANTATPEFSNKDIRDEYLKQLNQPEMQRVFRQHEARNKEQGTKKGVPEEKSQPKNNFSFFLCRKRKEQPQEERSAPSHTAKRARE